MLLRSTVRSAKRETNACSLRVLLRIRHPSHPTFARSKPTCRVFFNRFYRQLSTQQPLARVKRSLDR